METAPIAILQHVACFLPPSSRVALACSSRRLHQAAALAPASSSCSVDRWRFLACFEKSAARPLRWKCWLPDAKTERRLLHAALRRYQAFLLRKSTAPTPHFDGTESPPPAIPRVIHQIWLGSPLPDRFEAWRASYRTLHPGTTGRHC